MNKVLLATRNIANGGERDNLKNSAPHKLL